MNPWTYSGIHQDQSKQAATPHLPIKGCKSCNSRQNFIANDSPNYFWYLTQMDELFHNMSKGVFFCFFFLLLYAFHCSLRVKFTSCFSQGGCQTTTQPTMLGFTWLIALASCMTPPKQSPCSAAQSLDTCEISTPCSWDAEGGETFLHFTFPRKVGFAARRGVAFCGADPWLTESSGKGRMETGGSRGTAAKTKRATKCKSCTVRLAARWD